MPPTTKVAGQAYTVRVRGLEDLIRATDKLGGDIKKNTRRALRQAAEPVKADAVRKIRTDLNSDRSASKVGVSVRRIGTVSVEQRLRRTTGTRPDWGKTQMRKAFLPAQAENEDNTLREFMNVIDKASRRWAL